MVNAKLELVFVDKEGNFYPLNGVNNAELTEGLKRISSEIEKRRILQKEQR